MDRLEFNKCIDLLTINAHKVKDGYLIRYHPKFGYKFFLFGRTFKDYYNLELAVHNPLFQGKGKETT